MHLKILWLTNDFPSSENAHRHLYLWHPVEALKKIDIQTVVLNTPSWKPFSTKTIQSTLFPFEIKNISYLSLPRHYLRAFSDFFYSKRVVPAIKKLHQHYQFDVIHAHGQICGLAAVNAAHEIGIPSIVTMHGIDMCPRVWKGSAGEKFKKMLSEANKIVYVGESLQKHFLNQFHSAQHSCVIHNGLKLPKHVENKKNFAENKLLRIISVSNLHEGKGIDITLRALTILKNRGVKNWTYHIIGDGDQKKYLENLVEQYGLKEKVAFKGNCTHDQVYFYLENSDIFCLPSYREAFGIAYLEAMAHGLITIAVQGQGPEAFIDDHQTGFLMLPKSAESLSEILYKILNNFEEYQTIAVAGKQKVMKNFTWEKHAEKLCALYREVCDQFILKD